MKTNLINIGNSRGVILPASMLRDLKMLPKSEVDISVEDGRIVIKPQSRQGWEELFSQASDHGIKETDLFEGIQNDIDKEEWEW